MKIRCLVRICAIALAASSSHSFAASWKTCNGHPIGPQPNPVNYHANSCSFHDLASPEANAVVNGFSNLHYFSTVGTVTFGQGDACAVNHSDAQWDISLVDESSIDGNLGFTQKRYSQCFWPDDVSRILESDVMVQAVLDFSIPDESTVGTQESSPGMGIAVMLHEMGHSIGLEHSSDFAIMRNGMDARVPWTGSIYPNASKVMLTADDVFGIRNVYGFPQEYPNVYASAQYVETRNNQNVVQNTSTDPATGNALPAGIAMCPGDALSMFVTVGNHSQFTRTALVRVYADTLTGDSRQDACSSLPDVGAELGRWKFNVNAYSTYSPSVAMVIPATIPLNTKLGVYTGVIPQERGFGVSERRSYDNCVRHASIIFVRSADQCGK
jgi:hypothetical protein